MERYQTLASSRLSTPLVELHNYCLQGEYPLLHTGSECSRTREDDPVVCSYASYCKT